MIKPDWNLKKKKNGKSAESWSGRLAAAAQQHLQVQFLVSVEAGSTLSWHLPRYYQRGKRYNRNLDAK